MTDKLLSVAPQISAMLGAGFYLALIGWAYWRDRHNRVRRKEAMDDLEMYIRNPAEWKRQHDPHDPETN